MINVSLTITNPDKAELLRGLLLELPFVDIQYWGESHRSDLTNWLAIFARYQQIKRLGWGKVSGGKFSVWLFHGVSQSSLDKIGEPTLKLVYESLSTDPLLFQAEQVSLNGEKAYLVTLHGVKVLYELSTCDSALFIGYIEVA